MIAVGKIRNYRLALLCEGLNFCLLEILLLYWDAIRHLGREN